MLSDGKLVSSDLAWTEGMSAWGPVFDVIPVPRTPELPPPSAPSPLGATRRIQVMRPGSEAPPPERMGEPVQAAQPEAWRPEAPAPAPSQPPREIYQPPAAQAETAALHVQPVPPAPYASPADAWPGAPAPDRDRSAANQPLQAAPSPAPEATQVNAQQPFVPQAPPTPPPPAAQSLPYQPYPNQNYQGQPYPNQPYAGQPAPGQLMPAQAMPYAQPGAAVAGVPPGLHWAVVLILGMFTFGIFYIIWAFKQVNFVARVDPQNPARKLYVLAVILILVYAVLVGGAIAAQSTAALAIAGSAGLLVELAAGVCNLIAVFKMRTSLLNYYNTVEPIGLKLSPIMTFFFNILYFQHHFHRIAQWKRTGVLQPQA
jgi:hypothetical protein